jgi:hypothetical protein
MLAWSIAATKAGKFLQTLHPFLKVKAAHASVALAFLEQRKRESPVSVEELHRRDSFRQQLVHLNGDIHVRRNHVSTRPHAQIRRRLRREQTALKLRQRGWTLARIGQRLGTTAPVICLLLQRLQRSHESL